MKFYPMIGLTGLLLVNSVAYAAWDTSDPPTFAGDVLQIAIPLTGLGMAYAKGDTEGMKQLAYTVVVNQAITEGMKYGFDGTALGERPDGGRRSFPSGHTSGACAGATFIGQRYGWSYGSVAMVPAGYVGWSRVNAERHHVRDVVAGCALGVATGLLLTSPEGNQTITPWYENKTFGVTISSKW
ncbi:phosphatase PAP2 family protein [Psychrobacter sp.]|uniref:phosphatase PAP2 family protein n=1 Tax=Psychrobacter sp. TaxID=56811 RepID=UPI0025F58196|nr:phosphatase PAP2 family protein [Psychrobacter sp.]